jgi:hypothetical protein
MVDWVNRMARPLLAVLICLTAGNVAAEEKAWEPPTLDRDNPVFRTAARKPWSDGERMFPVLGPGMEPESFYFGTEMFWRAVKSEDVAGIIGAAHPTDGVGMAYGPPFTVWFPKQKGLDEILSHVRPEVARRVQSEWDGDKRRIWIINFGEVAMERSDSIFARARMLLVVFKTDINNRDVPGVCHARQVITVLYTGEADEAALLDCLEHEGTQ